MFGDLGLRPEMLVDLAINLANIVIMFLIVRFWYISRCENS